MNLALKVVESLKTYKLSHGRASACAPFADKPILMCFTKVLLVIVLEGGEAAISSSGGGGGAKN